jgi:hypothetical protein
MRMHVGQARLAARVSGRDLGRVGTTIGSIHQRAEPGGAETVPENVHPEQ